MGMWKPASMESFINGPRTAGWNVHDIPWPDVSQLEGFNLDAPSEFKDFHNLFTSLIYKYDVSMVFDDLLDYIIRFFLKDESIPWDKRYNEDENKIFYKMMQAWIEVMNSKCISDKDWFDFFGTYYEAEVVSKLGRKGAGQFFTPPEISHLMAELLFIGEKPVGQIFNDPAAGSGRCLIAKHVMAPGNYHVAQDLDNTCVKMTICNFIIHGVIGEVVWQNSLTLDWFGAWKVNEDLHLTGIPSVRTMVEEECNVMIKGPVPVKAESVTLDSFGVAK